MDPRPGATPRRVNEALELTYLRAERPQRGGVDITDRLELWMPYERVERYRRESLI